MVFNDKIARKMLFVRCEQKQNICFAKTTEKQAGCVQMRAIVCAIRTEVVFGNCKSFRMLRKRVFQQKSALAKCVQCAILMI